MTAKRTPIHREMRPRLTGELRAQAERLMVLKEAHRAAISGGDQSFYDARHEELVSLVPVVHQALGIRPWQDSYSILQEALAASSEATRR